MGSHTFCFANTTDQDLGRALVIKTANITGNLHWQCAKTREWLSPNVCEDSVYVIVRFLKIEKCERLKNGWS